MWDLQSLQTVMEPHSDIFTRSKESTVILESTTICLKLMKRGPFAECPRALGAIL